VHHEPVDDRESGVTSAPELSANALRVLDARYLLRDRERRVIETPGQMFERVARAVAEAEAIFGDREGPSYWAERYHALLTGRDFLPNSPTLMNAGTALGQLSACFVLPIEDTMESIFEALKQMALVQRTGGGTGFSFTRLRPQGDVVASTGGEASGPVSFMKIFDCATEHIKQSGKRRGANMGVLDVEHPDILAFILAHLVREPRGQAPLFDWQRLEAIVAEAVRFLDNVIEVNRYPLGAVEQMTRGTRKIGLGVMGFAEALIRLGMSYDSDEAELFAERLMRSVAEAAARASAALAARRGVFPAWKGSVYDAQQRKMRNATRTAIAPTGTIGIIAGTSASIEPLFALAYRRKGVLGGQTLEEVNPLFVEFLERRGLDRERVLLAVREHGRLAAVPDVPEEMKRLFVTALEIPAQRQLAMQAAFQRHADNSVSKTINLPQDATPSEVAQAYRRAWELGLKGITIYRYGARPAQVLELGVEEEAHHYDHASRCDPEECRI